MSFAAVQKHIAILERAGLVTKERVGRRKVVRTNLERLRVVRRLLDEYEELWRGRIQRMAALIADASPERVWQLWADPRQLERWWGPPSYPATVTKHILTPGGRVEYQMTGPEGDQHRGYWEVLEIDAPHRLVLRDGFANADGTPNTDLPLSTMYVRIEGIGGGRTRIAIEGGLDSWSPGAMSFAVVASQ